MMQINWQGQSKRKQRAAIFWNQIATEYNAGKSVQDISNMYINPKTGRSYTRAHIYWVLKKMSETI